MALYKFVFNFNFNLCTTRTCVDLRYLKINCHAETRVCWHWCFNVLWNYSVHWNWLWIRFAWPNRFEY